VRSCFLEVFEGGIQPEAAIGETDDKRLRGQVAAPHHALERLGEFGHEGLLAGFPPAGGYEREAFHEGLIGWESPGL
jgi:hypothetical protein